MESAPSSRAYPVTTRMASSCPIITLRVVPNTYDPVYQFASLPLKQARHFRGNTWFGNPLLHFLTAYLDRGHVRYFLLSIFYLDRGHVRHFLFFEVRIRIMQIQKDSPIELHIGKVAAKLQLLTGGTPRSSPFS